MRKRILTLIIALIMVFQFIPSDLSMASDIKMSCNPQAYNYSYFVN